MIDLRKTIELMEREREVSLHAARHDDDLYAAGHYDAQTHALKRLRSAADEIERLQGRCEQLEAQLDQQRAAADR